MASALLEKHIAAKALDRVEVALALHQQAKIAAQHIAVEHPALDGQPKFDTSDPVWDVPVSKHVVNQRLSSARGWESVV